MWQPLAASSDGSRNLMGWRWPTAILGVRRTSCSVALGDLRSTGNFVASALQRSRSRQMVWNSTSKGESMVKTTKEYQRLQDKQRFVQITSSVGWRKHALKVLETTQFWALQHPQPGTWQATGAGTGAAVCCWSLVCGIQLCRFSFWCFGWFGSCDFAAGWNLYTFVYFISMCIYTFSGMNSGHCQCCEARANLFIRTEFCPTTFFFTDKKTTV